MDLNFSPDWPAWLCYLIVLLFGVLTGWREVVEKIDDVSGVWRLTATWALMLIIGVSPVLLFWLLDRVGALHDTSAIAAAIVGVAYTQILKGDSEYKAPGSTSPIWNFLSWWRERIAKAVQDRAANNALAFDQAVCERLADPAKLASATALGTQAHRRSGEVPGRSLGRTRAPRSGVAGARCHCHRLQDRRARLSSRSRPIPATAS